MIISEKKIKVKKPDVIADVLRSILNAEHETDRDKEHLWTIGLNSSNVIQYIELVSLGILNQALVHPREVFRFAVMKGINSLIIAHNHPSGELNPSGADMGITEQLVKAGEILGIKVLDHIIVTDESFYSFMENDKI